MSDKNKPIPYQHLGERLRDFREGNRETVADAADAVEIDAVVLERVEAGNERPSEDILLLLISHFGVQDDAAAELWQLAGYDRPKDKDSDHEADMAQAAKTTMMVMLDPRVMYSDQVEIIANKQGVVLNFAQVNGPDKQPLVVSRIGMSESQAKIVMGLLHRALYEIDQPDNHRQLGDGQ